MKLAVAIMLCAVGLAAAQPRGPPPRGPPPLPPMPEEPEMQAAVSEKMDCGLCRFYSDAYDVSQRFLWINGRHMAQKSVSAFFLSKNGQASQPTPPLTPARRPRRTQPLH